MIKRSNHGISLQRAAHGGKRYVSLGEWTFEGEPKASASRLRRRATVICTTHFVREEASALNSGGTAIISPRAFFARGFFVLFTLLNSAHVGIYK